MRDLSVRSRLRIRACASSSSSLSIFTVIALRNWMPGVLRRSAGRRRSDRLVRRSAVLIIRNLFMYRALDSRRSSRVVPFYPACSPIIRWHAKPQQNGAAREESVDARVASPLFIVGFEAQRHTVVTVAKSARIGAIFENVAVVSAAVCAVVFGALHKQLSV